MPRQPLLGVGGAMDLAAGAKRLIVTMTHTQKNGEPKIVETCSLSLTAMKAVDTVINELAVFESLEGALTLVLARIPLLADVPIIVLVWFLLWNLPERAPTLLRVIGVFGLKNSQ